MANPVEYLILTFPSVHTAMQAEKLLDGREIPIKTIPTPREISSSCGLSIRTGPEFMDEILECKREGMKVDHIWKYRKEHKRSEAELLI